MRLFVSVLLAVAASASPEADPAVVYAGWPYAGYGYGLGHGYGLGYSLPVATYAHPTVGVVPTLGATPVAVGGYKAEAGSNGDLPGAVHEVPGLVGAPALATQEAAGGVKLTTGTGAYAVTGYNLVHALGKREAEAEPEADPALLYGRNVGFSLGGANAYTPFGLGGYYGLGLGYSGLAYNGLAHSGLVYSGLGHYGLGAHVIGKREAEAEPEADPEADPYLLYGHGLYGHGYGYSSLGYGYGYGLGYRGLGYRAYGGYYGYPHAYRGYYAYGK